MSNNKCCSAVPNPEKKVQTKIRSSTQPFSTMIEMFLEQNICILEWFLKDHVTLKTGVMMLKMT